MTLVGIAVALFFTSTLAKLGMSSVAWRWFFQSLVVLICIYLLVQRNLKYNYKLGNAPEHSSSQIGAANLLTITRGILISFLAGFLFIPWYSQESQYAWLNWVPGCIYLIASLADGLDGYVARSRSQSTKLGEIIDTQLISIF